MDLTLVTSSMDKVLANSSASSRCSGVTRESRPPGVSSRYGNSTEVCCFESACGLCLGHHLVDSRFERPPPWSGLSSRPIGDHRRGECHRVGRPQWRRPRRLASWDPYLSRLSDLMIHKKLHDPPQDTSNHVRIYTYSL